MTNIPTIHNLQCNQPDKTCLDCNISITSRGPQAKRCISCAQNREKLLEREKRRHLSRIRDRRLPPRQCKHCEILIERRRLYCKSCKKRLLVQIAVRNRRIRRRKIAAIKRIEKEAYLKLNPVIRTPEHQKRLDQRKIYRQKYRKEISAKAQMRKRRLRQNCPKWVNKKQLAEVYKNCPTGMVVDHIVPIKHTLVSGLHVPWNLQYLTPFENGQKNNHFDGTYENNGWKNR